MNHYTSNYRNDIIQSYKKEENRKTFWKGYYPPIVTPFTKEGEIDERKIRKEMEICMKAGANGLSVAGSTGEGPTLNDSELVQLIKIAKEYLDKPNLWFAV